ncbi:signal peptide protein [Devosia geojensis]|uniref:Signal peptide protein n=1 Tax=Devosia geojensis TaxID=443610 RepID=A0A0F5FYH0_9HYPH|nr:copper chaperone PCu(A)C [Devosia geojensis]KKB13227.1 signal peptide protein [Devosia geojensis]
MALCATSYLLVHFAPQAHAHAGIAPAEVANGTTVRAVITIPHGCDGLATDTVVVDLPEGFVNAKPMVKPGWQIATETGAYAKTYDDHGTPVTEGVLRVTWSGGALPDDQFDEFVVRGALQGFETETALPFTVTQHCGDEAIAWEEIAEAGTDPHSLERPAPVITVKPASGADAHAHHGGHGNHAAVVTAGDLEITGAFTRATLPGAPVGGGFLTITNTGAEDDRLIGASAAFAGEAQLHEMAVENDVMKMRELPDGIPVPAGEAVTLEPGGLHMMFMGLKEPLVEGTEVPVTLTFEKAGTVEVTLAVAAPGADAHGEHNH